MIDVHAVTHVLPDRQVGVRLGRRDLEPSLVTAVENDPGEVWRQLGA